MKKAIIFLFIVLVLAAVLFIAIDISKPANYNNNAGASENSDNKISGNSVDDASESIISGNVVAGGAGGSSGSSSGGSSSSGDSESQTGTETIPTKPLPADLYTQPCGYYFSEYGVCAGVCPDGECLVDEKSCYCRNVR